VLNITDLRADETIYRLLRDLCKIEHPVGTISIVSPKIRKKEDREHVYTIIMAARIKTTTSKNGIAIFWRNYIAWSPLDSHIVTFQILRPTWFEAFFYRDLETVWSIRSMRSCLGERLRLRGIQC